MAVERRHSNRIALTNDVRLIYRKRSFLAHMCNLSYEGMCLKIDALSIPRGMMLELDFQLAGRHWQIPSLVTHHSPGELGVMFISEQRALFDAVTRCGMPPQSDGSVRAAAAAQAAPFLGRSVA